MSGPQYYYNWAIGIQSALETYETLSRLINDRHEAGYNRKERLEEFIVLGRLRLDTAGNAMIITEPADHSWADGHPVLTADEAFALMQEKGIKRSMVSTSKCLPPAKVNCAICGKAWGLDNFTDFEVSQVGDTIPLREFVGQKLSDIQARVKERTSGLYIVCEYPIRNDKYIDLTPEKNYPTIKKNERGWVNRKFTGYDGTQHGVIDCETHIIKEGDEAGFQVLIFKHSECHMKQLRAKTYAEFVKAFLDSGLRIDVIEEVPNEYGSLRYNGPWFKIKTNLGVFKVGWRKRVIELDWRDTGQSYLHLFNDIEDTKDVYSIHVWQYTSLMEYLRRIVSSTR